MPTESKPIKLNVDCPAFSLPAVTGEQKTLATYQHKQILVIGFTCNHCPYVQAYEERLMQLVRLFQNQSVAFVCINSNDEKTYPEDSFEKMKERAQKLKFNFDYLRDESQMAARAFNAACTPEFYVYDAQRKLRYHGRLDDNHKDLQAVKNRYLENAIQSLLRNQPPATAQTPAMGCSIKWMS